MVQHVIEAIYNALAPVGMVAASANAVEQPGTATEQRAREARPRSIGARKPARHVPNRGAEELFASPAIWVTERGSSFVFDTGI